MVVQLPDSWKFGGIVDVMMLVSIGAKPINVSEVDMMSLPALPLVIVRSQLMYRGRAATIVTII